MPNYTAQDVKRLRDETDAPMMECKMALDEADGDFEKAKLILREKGKAAAAKRADRTTASGVVAVARAHDHKTIGGVVLECETDFVARNESFIAIAQELAEIFLHNAPGADPLAVKHGDKTVGEIIEEAVAKIRENIRLTKAIHEKANSHFTSYVHHDKMKAVIVEYSGDQEVGGAAAYQIAIQAIAFPPEVITKDELSQEKIDAEIEAEKNRAMNEGKDEKMAENIARGRVNKEYIKRVVLMEQPFYREPEKSVAQFLAETAKGFGLLRIIRLAVGEGS